MAAFEVTPEVVDAYTDDAVLCKQLPRKKQARVNHRKPRRVISTAGLGITREQISLRVNLAC